MHHKDAANGRRELHKNITTYTEQILEETSHETAAVWPPTSNLEDELKSDVLLWTPSHGLARVGRPTRTYLQRLCTDTGSNLEDLQETMDD